MKKLLLLAAILALSSTAMATNTSTLLDSAKTATLSVSAHYVEPLAVSLNLSAIDFGDVYTDSAISTEAVIATVTGTDGETFSYTVNSNGSLVLLTGNISGTNQAFVTGSSTLTFNVGLDTANLVENEDVSETVTISVQYESIADTTTTPVS